MENDVKHDEIANLEIEIQAFLLRWDCDELPIWIPIEEFCGSKPAVGNSWAMLVGGIAVFAKVAGAMKAAGGAKLGVAAAAMTAAATAAVSGTKQEQKDVSK
ncbi:hypothetical protein ACLOJK_037825 [Asimina triloba]